MDAYEGLEQEQAYWLKQFGGELPVLDLPLDYPRPQFRASMALLFNGSWMRRCGNVYRRLARHGSNGIYGAALGPDGAAGKYSRQEDIIVGSPVSGRMHQDTEQMVGMFVGTLALRGKPEGSKGYRQFLSRDKGNESESL